MAESWFRGNPRLAVIEEDGAFYYETKRGRIRVWNGDWVVSAGDDVFVVTDFIFRQLYSPVANGVDD